MKHIKHFYLFVSGMILAFDFTGLIGRNFFLDSKPVGHKSDRDNIASDWQNVGKTLQKVLNDDISK